MESQASFSVSQVPSPSNEPISTLSSAAKEGSKEATQNDSAESFPDGGLRAWLVVLGVASSYFATFGFISSWGVFQSYYEENLLKNTSPSTIAWIGSVQYALMFLPGLLTGRMFDLGIFKIPFVIASAVLVASCFITAECTKYWHFLLVQGILLGLACGTIFSPSLGVLGHWFKERRGLAFGMAALGSATGGTVLPIAARRLIPLVGFKWTMRILGFILLVVMAFPNITLRRRLPPKRLSGGIFNYRIFKVPAFSLYSCAIWLTFVGLYTVSTYIDIRAVRIGVSADFSFYLVAIINASGGIGRLFAAAMIDKTGPFNFYIPMAVVTAIVTYAWPYANSKNNLIVIAILYGFFSGAFMATWTLPVYGMGDIHDVGRRSGTLLGVAALGALIGPPISGAISQYSGGFTAVGYYAGTMILISSLFLLATRYALLHQWTGKC